MTEYKIGAKMTRRAVRMGKLPLTYVWMSTSLSDMTRRVGVMAVTIPIPIQTRVLQIETQVLTAVWRETRSAEWSVRGFG